MTGAQLKAMRKAAEPTLSQNEFARRLGYKDADSYRKYESGAREIPHLLRLVMQALSTGWRPDGWDG